MRAEPSYRYEEVVHFITMLVDNGALTLGSRAPSLREICRQRRVSLSTALQAYRLLEDRGVLEARPQSGYYVTRPGPAALPTPRPSRSAARPSKIALSGVVAKLLDHAGDPALV